MQRWILSLLVTLLGVWTPAFSMTWSENLSTGELSPDAETTEELAFAIMDGPLTAEQQELLLQLTPTEIDEINIILADVTNEWNDEIQGEAIDGCENIQSIALRGYSYVRPYTYWLKWEWNGPDLMLEYSHYPSGCNGRKAKSFYITDVGLWQRLTPCGIAVRYDAMERGCKRRVTAVIGYSRWYVYGANLTAYHTQLGFER